jgi:hypothetical protein
MSASIESLKISAAKLRKQIAATEATLSGLKLKLAKAEAGLTGEPVPVSGLDVLWAAAFPTARTRSSKQQCRIEWNKIPRAERPTVETLVAALKAWNRCDEWKKDGHAFVPGLHKWLKNRCWEDLPEVEAAPSRTRTAPIKSAPKTAPGEQATPAEIAAIFATLKPKFS